MTDISNMFASTNFKGGVSKWDASSVTDMEGMFANADRFDGDILRWGVSRVTKNDTYVR